VKRTVPIKVQVCDATGSNVSSSNLVVSSAGLTRRDSSASSVTCMIPVTPALTGTSATTQVSTDTSST
jgi:hypothetical protein